MHLPRLFEHGRQVLMGRLVLNGLLQAACAVSGVLLVKHIFETAITPLQADSASISLWVMAGIVLLVATSAGLRMLERIDAERLGQGYVHQVRLLLYAHLSSLLPRNMQQRRKGGMMLRFLSDLTALRQWLSLGLARLAVSLVSICVALAAMAFLNWQLSLVVSVILAAGMLLMWMLGDPLERTVRKARYRRSCLAGNLNEKVASMAVVQVSGQTRREQNRIERQSSRLRAAMVERARMIGGLRAVTAMASMLATFAALLTGAYLVRAGQTTPGMVVAAMSITAFLAPSLRDIGRVYEYWHGARVSREKLERYLGRDELAAYPAAVRGPRRGAGRIEFRDVSVNGSITDFRATIQPGRVVALVGPNGAGKSTLLSLAARLVRPDDGRVLVDGRDLASISRDSLRRVIGMVSAELPLLSGTIRKNLYYRWRQAPAEEVGRVSEQCGLAALLDTLPEGDATRVVEGGSNLSTGQRRAVALARALLGSPRLLLLDEPDAGLDSAALSRLDGIVANYPGTVLLATHRPELARRADEIWFLQAGRLVERGAPADLLDTDSAVAAFFRQSGRPRLVS